MIVHTYIVVVHEKELTELMNVNFKKLLVIVQLLWLSLMGLV